MGRFPHGAATIGSALSEQREHDDEHEHKTDTAVAELVRGETSYEGAEEIIHEGVEEKGA